MTRLSSGTISLEGKFGKKGRKDSKTIAQRVREQTAAVITSFISWKKVPRALMAVTTTFFPGDDANPAVHNLVKFYLDELRQTVFTDDRQVGFLRAECWSRSYHSAGVERSDSRVHIRVERLADYLDWQGHSPEEIQAMKDSIADKEPIDD